MQCKCVECGYLTLRRLATNDINDGADIRYRKGGFIPVDGQSRYYLYEEMPICWKGVVDFESEVGASNRINGYKAASKERECEEFTQWRSGYSPKDHDEMKFVRQIEALYENRHQELRRDSERQHRQTLKIMGLGLLITLIAAVISGVVSGMLSALP